MRRPFEAFPGGAAGILRSQLLSSPKEKKRGEGSTEQRESTSVTIHKYNRRAVIQKTRRIPKLSGSTILTNLKTLSFVCVACVNFTQKLIQRCAILSARHGPISYVSLLALFMSSPARLLFSCDRSAPQI